MIPEGGYFMELNIMELYKLMTEFPEEFPEVLRNICKHDLLSLIAASKNTAFFIQSETGEDARRNKYIESELQDLSNSIETATAILTWFRCVNIEHRETLECFSSLEELRLALLAVKGTIDEQIEKCDSLFQKGENGRVQNQDKFTSTKNQIMEVLDSVTKKLEKIDQKL